MIFLAKKISIFGYNNIHHLNGIVYLGGMKLLRLMERTCSFSERFQRRRNDRRNPSPGAAVSK